MHQLKHIQATRVDTSFMALDASMFATCSTRCCHKRRRREIQWKHLVVTDVVWARSTTGFNETFEKLQQLGVPMQDGVNAFDFMRCLASNEQISLAARQHGFDVIVMYGVNFGVFEQTRGTLDLDHPVSLEQYTHRDKLGIHTPQTKVFHEAILGQDPYTTIINIHAENHQRYFLSATSMAYLRLGLFNPSRLRMRTGANNNVSTAPLVSTITSHSLRQMSQFIKINASMEEQLDLNKCLIDTLAAGGHVLVLGAGRLDICRELMKAANDGEYAAKDSYGIGIRRATSLTKPGRRAKFINGHKVTYWDHCLHDEEVRFEHVVNWTLTTRFGWCASGVRP